MVVFHLAIMLLKLAFVGLLGLHGLFSTERHLMIVVNHMTGMIYNYHQVTFSAEETVQAKQAYERELEQHDRKVKHYHADNGVFDSMEFRESVDILNQKITFSGVGAHHQNGKVERAIQMVVEKARTVMLHASMHWPETFSMDLWPYAIDYAVFIYNHTPRMEDGVTPIEHMCNIMVLAFLTTVWIARSALPFW